VKIQIAQDSKGNDILISDATKKEKYVCYDCNGTLIPKKGTKNQHHYSHKNNKINCNGESWQHKFAKKFIKKYLPLFEFKVKCSGCNNENKYCYDNCSAIEEYTFSKYRLDLGIITDDNHLKSAIEILHTHETEEDKIKFIVDSNIDFIEIRTEDILNIRNDVKNGNKVLLNSKNINYCRNCSPNIISNQFINTNNTLFGNRNKTGDMIEIRDGKLFMMLYDKIKFFYEENQIINDDYCENNYKIKETIIAGSFLTYFLQKCLYELELSINTNWIYNDIDVWVYEENGLKSLCDGYSILNYLDYVKQGKSIVIKKNKYNINLIKTPYAINITNLLCNFDIPCCQIGFYENCFYLSHACLSAILNRKNIMKCDKNICEKEIILEYIFDKTNVENGFRNIMNYNNNVLRNFDPDGYINKEYIPKYPILYNVSTNKEKFNTIQSFKKDLKCGYANKDKVKKIGAVFDYKSKKWHLLSTKSITSSTEYINNNFGLDMKFTSNASLWSKNDILIISTKDPLVYWCYIYMFSKHNQSKRKLCGEIVQNNISDSNAMKILHLSGIGCDKIRYVKSRPEHQGGVG
jgi:hypothetical protein